VLNFKLISTGAAGVFGPTWQRNRTCQCSATARPRISGVGCGALGAASWEQGRECGRHLGRALASSHRAQAHAWGAVSVAFDVCLQALNRLGEGNTEALASLAARGFEAVKTRHASVCILCR